MPASFSNGNVFVLQLDATPGGSLAAMSAYVSNIELESERDDNELARGGGNAKARLVGAVGHAGTLDFWYHPTIVDCLRAHMDQATPVTCSVSWDPQGTASGNPRRVMEVYFTSLSEQTNADDPAQGSADFVVDGAITTTAQA